MSTIIGFTGRKRSGKDTASAVFEAAGFERLSFAGPIKDMLGVLLEYQGVTEDVIERMLEGDLKEVPTPFLQGRSPRYAMQTLGTEWGRAMIGDALWVDALLNASEFYEQVVVSDVRFPNEVTALKEAGAVIYRISRPDNPLGANDNHASEANIDTLEVDGEILNTAPTAEAFQEELTSFFDPPAVSAVQ